MRTAKLVLWVLALAGIVGCGGGSSGDSGGDELRTDIACSNGLDQECATMHADVPAKLTCNPGYQEVSPCPAAGALATCTEDLAPFHGTLYVYAASLLDTYHQECINEGGTWLTF